MVTLGRGTQVSFWDPEMGVGYKCKQEKQDVHHSTAQ